jgi:hypothetical protein
MKAVGDPILWQHNDVISAHCTVHPPPPPGTKVKEGGGVRRPFSSKFLALVYSMLVVGTG